MNSDKREDYYVGLDMGTGSLGGAVTDTQYHLLKVKGKDFWFVREYETAKSQLDRRTHRIAKRRLQRHKARIGLIRSYFAEDILKHDPLFYIRQDNSKYYQEDKDARLTTKDSLFADPGYGDKEYHDVKEYPTIFHLRQALLRDQIKDEERYSRFLYLAIINMFEHRGHFLLNTESSDLNAYMIKDVGELVMNAICGVSEYGSVTYKEIIEILEDKNISRTAKKDQIAFFSNRSFDFFFLIFKSSLLKCNLNLFIRLDFKHDSGICFHTAQAFDPFHLCFLRFFDIDFRCYLIIENMKQLYDYSQLQSVLNGFDYLSDARVQMYEKHKEDLHLLKKVYRKNLDREMYNRMFRSGEEGSYCAYSNSTNSVDSLAEAKKYRRNMKKRSQKDLYDRIKKDLKEVHDADVDAIRKEMELERFLPKQITGANGIIPNQVHRKELKKILENAEHHLDFLKEKDESGYTVSERILMLFSSNIPYYVGPVGSGSKTGWAKIQESGQVLPWNMEQKIDIEQTSERFITNLIRECTYLSGEKVLPKQSLLYESYCVLNEINNLRIHGKRIVPELKQDIYKEVFQGSRLGKKVTKKNICTYLINRGLITEESEVSGIDKEINAYLPSYGKMYSVFGERLRKEAVQEIAEKIIYSEPSMGMLSRCSEKN